MSSQKRAVIIGAGIGGIATSILLQKLGYQTDIYEKLNQVGGRARQLKASGFTFDMGPSWYLMPGVFEHFYKLIGEDISLHLDLIKLNPAYKVMFENDDPITIQGNLRDDVVTFESIELGAGSALRSYINRAEKTYKLAVENFLYTNFRSPTKMLGKAAVKEAPFMLKSAVQPIDQYVSSYFKDVRLKQIMEYPMVFLGASPFTAPALYHLMSYMDFEEGVYYPKGGIYTVIDSLRTIAEQSGVRIHTNTPASKIIVKAGKAVGVEVKGNKNIDADIVISNADLHFTETELLDRPQRSYGEPYWQKRKNGPSALLYYLGIKGKLPQLEHHTLYFAQNWKGNFDAIYKNKTAPDPASMYICKPSQTDPTVAPKGYENIFVLVPLPARQYSKTEITELSDRYFEQLKHILSEPNLESRIQFKKVYTPEDFASDYNAWEGTALGLSHTLRQSALFRPTNRSKRVKNLYYVGGNTIPGIGLPMCLISAELIIKHLSRDSSRGPLNKLPEQHV